MPTTTFYKLNPEKQQKIIDSAIENFARNGYSGTSMDSVAESAGIAKGALYRYFSGKKSLYMLVVDTLRDDIAEFAREFIESRKESNVFETIRDWLVSIYEFQEMFSAHLKIICNMLYQENIDFKGEVLAKFGKLSTQYTRIVLQRGIARGEVREDIDLDSAAFIIESLADRFHDGVIIPFMDHGFGLYQQPQEVIERKADQIIESFRLAFEKPSPDNEGPSLSGNSSRIGKTPANKTNRSD